eukprot:3054691-Prymnesium_polylepis.1
MPCSARGCGGKTECLEIPITTFNDPSLPTRPIRSAGRDWTHVVARRHCAMHHPCRAPRLHGMSIYVLPTHFAQIFPSSSTVGEETKRRPHCVRAAATC